jgi:tetratricopeptide (TPR) repeat protein
MLGVFPPSVLCQTPQTPQERAEALLAERKFSEALKAAEEAVEKDGEDPRAFQWKADALKGLERWSAAAEAYKEAIRRWDSGGEGEAAAIRGVCEVRYRQAEALIESGEPFAALDALNDALIWDIDFLDAMLLRGSVLEQIGREEEAEDEYLTALKKKPAHPDALYFAAFFNFRRNRFEEAMPHLDRLLSHSDPAPTPETLFWAHMSRGRIFAEKGERGRARNDFAKARAIDPSSEEAQKLFQDLETFRVQADRVIRAERWLLLASLATLIVYFGTGIFVWRLLRRKAFDPPGKK